MIGLSVRVQGGRLELNKKQVKRTLRSGGQTVATAARRLLRQSGSGRVYYGSGGSSGYRGGYQSGRHQASAPGQSPVNWLGALSRSIKVLPFQSGEGVAIRATQFYALFLEAGAKGGGSHLGRAAKNAKRRSAIATSRVLEPRPLLTATLDARRSTLSAQLVRAINQGLSFKAAR